MTNTLRQPKPAANVPTQADYTAIERLVALGPQSARAKAATKVLAEQITDPKLCYRLYRAAATHGHHTIGQIFVERHAEILQEGL